ncbi:MAG TPA: hypothetical protein VF240_00875 [Pyrinomonadaceae bacterium]
MARNVNTKFAAHAALPFALLVVLLLAQGGSCQKGAAGTNAAKSSNPAAAKASNSVAGANSKAGDGKGVTAVNKMSETTSGGDVAAGSWGGQHVRLEVKSDGAEIEFDCAHGRINGRLRPGADGRFDAAGTFVAERGGPVREGASEKGQPARYTGQIKGKTMTLSVRLTDSDTDAGAFTLTHGRESELVKCR